MRELVATTVFTQEGGKMKRCIVGLVVLAVFGVGQTNAAIYTVVDLTPSGFNQCTATDISGTQQVGYGSGNTDYHALLWSGTAASAVDLHPSGFDRSIAYGIRAGAHSRLVSVTFLL